MTHIPKHTISPEKLSDTVSLTKANIEAELTGEITSHTHPGGGGSGDLVSTNNLSDVANASTALSNLGGEPLKGADDNYVTDAEKVVIGNTSGTNTGDQVIPTALSDLSDDSTHRVVTDAEKSTWNGKQDALGFTAADDDAVVHDTGNETIAGEKTFSTFPITPSAAPDADYEVANKKYVDDNAGGGSKEYASFYLTTGGVTSVAATATTLVINNTGVNSNESVFGLASNEVTVNKTGTFLISANVYFNTGGSSRSEYSKWLEVDTGGGYAEVPGSRFVSYQRGYDSGQTATLTLMLAVTSGDKFRLRAQRTDGGATTGYQDANGTRFTILEL